MLADIIWDSGTLAMLIPIVSVIGGCWIAVAKITSDTNLKRRMVERGMSADEIEQVMKMKS